MHKKIRRNRFIEKNVLFDTLKKYVEFKKIGTKIETNIKEFIFQLKKEKKTKFTNEFKFVIKNEPEPIYIQIKEILSIDKIKQFVNKINETSEKYNIKGLKLYNIAIYS